MVNSCKWCFRLNIKITSFYKKCLIFLWAELTGNLVFNQVGESKTIILLDFLVKVNQLMLRPFSLLLISKFELYKCGVFLYCLFGE